MTRSSTTERPTLATQAEELRKLREETSKRITGTGERLAAAELTLQDHDSRLQALEPIPAEVQVPHPLQVAESLRRHVDGLVDFPSRVSIDPEALRRDLADAVVHLHRLGDLLAASARVARATAEPVAWRPWEPEVGSSPDPAPDGEAAAATDPTA